MDHIKILEIGYEWIFANGLDLAANVVVFFIILIVGAIAIKTIKSILRKMLDKSAKVDETLKTFVVNVLGKVLWVVLLMLALPRLGVDIAPLVAGLGVTGFIVGFAFQDSLGNLAAGLMLLLNRPFNVGDYIEAGGHAGAVQELNMMATVISTPDNKRITLPNSTIWGGSITNYSAYDTRRVDLTVGVSYAADLVESRQIIESVIVKNEMVLKDPAHTIEVVEMADSSVNFVVRPWCKTADYWGVYFSLTRDLKIALDKAGIEIPFPQMDVHHHGITPAS